MFIGEVQRRASKGTFGCVKEETEARDKQAGGLCDALDQGMRNQEPKLGSQGDLAQVRSLRALRGAEAG